MLRCWKFDIGRDSIMRSPGGGARALKTGGSVASTPRRLVRRPLRAHAPGAQVTARADYIAVQDRVRIAGGLASLVGMDRAFFFGQGRNQTAKLHSTPQQEKSSQHRKAGCPKSSTRNGRQTT